MACWSRRGCDDEMRAGCPHAINPAEKCPLACQFAYCDRPAHALPDDPLAIFDPGLDRSAAAREICTRCAFFIANGPRLP